MNRLLRNVLIALAVLVVLVILVVVGIGFYAKSQILDSGGPLKPLEAVYDVRHYDLDLAVDPASRSIRGRNVATLRAVEDATAIELDLDGRLEITALAVDGSAASWVHRHGAVRIELPGPWRSGERHEVRIEWRGRPKKALKAPWIDGFVWKRTPEGDRPWIGVTCEGDGADIWWPCKDHPSDEPDEGVRIALTVPKGLVGLSNGRPLGTTDNGDGTVTSRWEVTYPINNYDVTVNIAPYVPVEARYHGVDGTLDLPILFWALPEHRAEAERMWRQAPRLLGILASWFGEYPFIRDKYWVAEAPYLGMEHQTLVAYGADFEDNSYGFDDLLLHETAHEWWGNAVTAADWADFWLHEGFATWAEAACADSLGGRKEYLRYMRLLRHRIANRKPIVQGRNLTAAKAYTGDIYAKGAWVLHMLRGILGDETFRRVILGFATDPRIRYHTVTTGDWIAWVREATGRDLDWFWSRYLYRAELPEATVSIEPGDRVRVRWKDDAFQLPVPVSWEGGRAVLGPANGWSVAVPEGATVTVDPEGWTLATYVARNARIIVPQ